MSSAGARAQWPSVSHVPVVMGWESKHWSAALSEWHIFGWENETNPTVNPFHRHGHDRRVQLYVNVYIKIKSADLARADVLLNYVLSTVCFILSVFMSLCVCVCFSFRVLTAHRWHIVCWKETLLEHNFVLSNYSWRAPLFSFHPSFHSSPSRHLGQSMFFVVVCFNSACAGIPPPPPIFPSLSVFCISIILSCFFE